jgi:hypothetical protein
VRSFVVRHGSPGCTKRRRRRRRLQKGRADGGRPAARALHVPAAFFRREGDHLATGRTSAPKRALTTGVAHRSSKTARRLGREWLLAARLRGRAVLAARQAAADLGESNDAGSHRHRPRNSRHRFGVPPTSQGRRAVALSHARFTTPRPSADHVGAAVARSSAAIHLEARRSDGSCAHRMRHHGRFCALQQKRDCALHTRSRSSVGRALALTMAAL